MTRFTESFHNARKPSASRRVQSGRAKSALGAGRGRRPRLEELEDRTLLSAPPVDFAHLHELLLPPGRTQTAIGAPVAGPVNLFYEFAVNGAPQGQLGHFTANPTSNQADQATLGLYDISGNFLGPFQSPVADFVAGLTPGQVYILGVFLNAAHANDQFDVASDLSGETQQAAITLKDMALRNDSKDNVTCLIIHVVSQQVPAVATS